MAGEPRLTQPELNVLAYALDYHNAEEAWIQALRDGGEKYWRTFAEKNEARDRLFAAITIYAREQTPRK